MDKLTQDDATSQDIVADNIDKLKAIFPEAFTEGKVDFDMLKETLGEYHETLEERYNFSWAGKSKARRLAQTPTTGTLRPCPEESVDWDKTENLFIEGDNLEVLKLLQKSYQGQVKMIYIDPPYNTGGDFVYPDKYADNLKGYLEYTNQVDAGGNKHSSNTEASGRYHSNWLNMMLPRLKLSKNLLRQDGVIFISIDDNEVAQLKRLCQEVFGEENFIGQIIWKNVTDNNPSNVTTEHEYILVFAKAKHQLEAFWKSQLSDIKNLLLEIGDSLTRKFKDQKELQRAYTKWFTENKSQLGELDRYKYIDEGGVYTGSQSVHNPGKEGYRYDIIHPVTQKACKQPLMGYRFPEETMNQMISDGRILFGENESKLVEIKVYAKDFKQKLSSVINLDGRTGTTELKDLFPETNKVFTNPKTIRILEELISFATKDGDLILDFFSGSGSTAHATFKLNAQDGASRKCILVQLPELNYTLNNGEKVPKKGTAGEAYNAGFETIADICRERIRRAAAKIKVDHPDYDGDLGFKVFKLDSSNVEAWDSNIENLEDNVLNAANVLKDDRSELDIVYELFLKYGLDLSYPVNTHEVAGKQVYEIGAGSLFICLEDGITTDFVEALIKLYESFDDEAAPRVVFKDSGFKTDAAKKDAESTLKDTGILDVKCL